MSHIGYEPHKENMMFITESKVTDRYIVGREEEILYIHMDSYLGIEFTKIKFNIITYADNWKQVHTKKENAKEL